MRLIKHTPMRFSVPFCSCMYNAPPNHRYLACLVSVHSLLNNPVVS
jgi:hypothetical protein